MNLTSRHCAAIASGGDLEEAAPASAGDGDGGPPAPDAPAPIKAPDSARRALEEARRVVRMRRQQAKDRSAAAAAAATAAATGASSAPRNIAQGKAKPAAATPATPAAAMAGKKTCPSLGPSSGRGGGGGGGGSSSWPGARSYGVPRPSTTAQQRRVNYDNANTRRHKGAGRGGGRGIRRGRVLPDFTGIDASASSGVEAAAESEDEKVIGDDDDAAALVGAIRATLESTVAQLDEAAASAARGTAGGTGGVVASRAYDSAQQVGLVASLFACHLDSSSTILLGCVVYCRGRLFVMRHGYYYPTLKCDTMATCWYPILAAHVY